MQSASSRQGIVLLASAVMPIMAIVSLIPVLPLLLDEFSGVPNSAFLVPMALTIPALCVALFSPLAGWLSDKLGRKRLLVGALLLYAVFGIVPWFLDNLVQIILARFALGVVEAVVMTVATVLVGDYFSGERREKWIALQVAVGSIAAIVLIAISGVLGEVLGARGPFLLYLLALPIALAAAIILFEPKISMGNDAVVGQAFPLSAVLPLVLTTLFVGIIFYTVNVQLGPILEASASVSPAVIGIIGAVCNLAVGAGTLAFHRLRQRAGPQVLAVGMVLASLGYAGMAAAPRLEITAAGAVLACIGNGMMLPNMLAWTMATLPPPMRGRGMGLWTGSFFFAQFLAPLVLAAITAFVGNISIALLAYAVAAAFGALVAFLSLKSQPRPAP